MITTTCPGNFCALAAHSGHYYVAGKDNGRLQMVVRRLDGNTFVETHAYDMGGDSGAGFPSMVNNAQDQLWLGYIPADGLSAEVVNLTTRETRSHRIDGWKCQTWAIVLGPKGYAINWNGSIGPTQVYDYSGQLVTTIPGGAPTGLARLAPDNSAVITNDQNRPEEIEWGIYEPDYAGPVLAGEGFNGGIPLVYANQQKIVLAEGTYAYRPRVARLGDSWAAAATGVGFRGHHRVCGDHRRGLRRGHAACRSGRPGRSGSDPYGHCARAAAGRGFRRNSGDLRQRRPLVGRA